MYYTGQNLLKQYGAKVVLNLDEIKIPFGKCTVIMGPNGAGKSTLLRMLAFLDIEYGGNLFLRDLPVPKSQEKLREYRCRSALIWQRPVMFNMSVFDNVALGLKLRGQVSNKTERAQRVEAALARLGVEHLAKANAKRLSGGEVQKVSIARSLVLEPELIFVDEPSSNLDVDSIDLLHSVLLEEKAKGRTIILITHNFSEAQTLADYGVFLHQGQLVIAGDFPAVLNQPEFKNSSYWRYL